MMLIRLNPRLAAELDEWRLQEPDQPSREAAVLRVLERQLAEWRRQRRGEYPSDAFGPCGLK